MVYRHFYLNKKQMQNVASKQHECQWQNHIYQTEQFQNVDKELLLFQFQ